MFGLHSKIGKKGIRERALQQESGVLGADWLCESSQYHYMGQDTWVLKRWALDLDRPGLMPALPGTGWRTLDKLPDFVKP